MGVAVRAYQGDIVTQQWAKPVRASATMKRVRIQLIINAILAIALITGGIYVLNGEAFVLHTEEGSLRFAGVAKHLLALFLFLLAGFAIAVARFLHRYPGFWPSRDRIVLHPERRVRLIGRYWYLTAPALAALLLSLWLAE